MQKKKPNPSVGGAKQKSGNKLLFITLIFFFSLILIPSLVSASISFISGDGNNYIRLVAEPGEGDSWENAFSFEKIVDYFKNNPIPSISMPSDQDLTEGHGDWAGGVASPADGNFPVLSSTVTVENATGFNSSGRLVWLKDDYSQGYPNYIDYTGISGNSFTGCTWDKFYGNYMMDIDDGEWVWQYRKDTISTDSADKQVGSNSLVYTHDNDGSNAVIMWVANMESWSEGIDAYCAEELRFWIKPSSPNIVLEEVIVRDWYKYTNGRVFYYGDHWTGQESEGEGFNLSSGNWTENRIKIREYGMDSKYGVKDWMHRVSMIAFRFSGLQNGDTIKIDGVRFYLDDPNPREIKTNVYLFPIKIYNYNVQNQDFYFWDYGKTVIFNQLVGDLFKHYERDYRSYLRFGREGSASDNEQPMGIVLFWNTWCGGNTFFYFEGNPSGDESRGLRLQVDGLRVMASHPTLDGPQWRGRFLYVNESYMRNSQFEEVGDWFWEGYSEIVNIVLWGHRYTPWYPPSEGATIKNVKIWLNQNYMWIDEGTLRDCEVVSAREGTIWFNQRDYGATSNRTTTFIDWTFPDGFFDSSHDYQARQRSTYTPYSLILRIGNSVKIKVVDRNGNPIQGATVTCKDKDGNIAWTDTTDANGETDKHDIIHREWITSSGERTIYMDTPDNYYYPYTLTISHQSYAPKEIRIPTDEKIDWTITLDDRPMSSGIIDVYGTEYAPGEEGVIYAQVLYGDGSPANNATCIVTIFNKNTTWVANQPMNYISGSDGSYYYNFTVPSNISVFMVNVRCSNPTAYGSGEFHVSTWARDITQGLKLYAHTGSFYSPNDEIDIYVTTTNNQGALINTTVNVEIFYPDGTSLSSGQASYYKTGRAKYTFTLPSNAPTGTYRVEIDSNYSYYYAHETLTFLISPAIEYIKSEINNEIIPKLNELYNLIGQVKNTTSYINNTRWGSYVMDNLYMLINDTKNIADYLNNSVWDGYNASYIVNITESIKSVVDFVNNSKWGDLNASQLYDLSNTIYSIVDNIENIVLNVNTTVVNISKWEWYYVYLTDFSEIVIGDKYKCYLTIYDKDGYLVNATVTPVVTVYDGNGNMVTNNAPMTQKGTGIYYYEYSTSSGQPTGQWTVETTTIINGRTAKNIDYFGVEGNAPEVKVSIVDNTIPDIKAKIQIINEGETAQEYTYYYWIATRPDARFTDPDVIDGGSASKLIEPNEVFTTTVTLNVENTGQYWVKVLVYYGTESSGASAKFNAVRPTHAGGGPSGGGGGGGGGGISKRYTITIYMNINSAHLVILNDAGYLIFSQDIFNGDQIKLTSGIYTFIFTANGYKEYRSTYTINHDVAVNVYLEKVGIPLMLHKRFVGIPIWIWLLLIIISIFIIIILIKK